MRVFAIGLLFWVFTFLVLARLAGTWIALRKVRASGLLLAFALLVFAVLVMFRPHEVILGGQDDGAYLNIGARLARAPQLPYTDPLLSQVQSREARLDFLYYGRGRPYLSKFGCGRIADLDEASLSTWFQPAYPIVSSLAGAMGSSRWVLYVVPLFALFTAFALGALATSLISRPWAGGVAFFLYLANPLVIWHGRSPRPEIIASFLMFAGAALLVEAWNRRKWTRWYDVLLGAYCFGLAPFFHITAWMLVLPAGLVAMAIILAGRDDFLLYPPVAITGLLAFIYQTLRVCDPYGLRRFLAPVVAHPGIAACLLAAGLCLLVAAGLYAAARRRKKKGSSESGAAVIFDRPAAGWIAAAVILVAYLACLAHSIRFPPDKDNIGFHYVFRTDINSVLTMISLPIGALGLAGLLVFAAAREHRKERLALLFVAVPATLMIGNMYDFFMTRYLMVSLLPLLALGLTALVAMIPAGNIAGRGLVVLATAAICLLGLHNRTQLVKTVEYSGFRRYLESYADRIRQDDGILLCEYPRIAAPFDHFFGVPALALHNERDDDYSRAEAAWEQIMRANPGRPAYFATPFDGPPLSDRFGFVRVDRREYSGRRLIQRRWDLPRDVGDWGISLSMYRMTLSDSVAGSSAGRFPFVYEPFDAGNMGLRKFANIQTVAHFADGVTLEADHPLTLPVPSWFKDEKPGELLFFIVSSTPPPAIQAEDTASGTTRAVQPERLVRDWWIGRLGAESYRTADRLRFTSSAPLFLSDVIAAGGSSARSLLHGAGIRTTRQAFMPAATRWARKDAEICVPVPAGGKGYVLLLQNMPGMPMTRNSLGLDSKKGVPVQRREVESEKWLWCVWPVGGLGVSGGNQWLKLVNDSPFDPQTRGYPTDLISHAAIFAVVE